MFERLFGGQKPERTQTNHESIHARDPRYWKVGDVYDRMSEMAGFNQPERDILERDLVIYEAETLELMRRDPLGIVIYNDYEEDAENGYYVWRCITDHGDHCIYSIETRMGQDTQLERCIFADQCDPAIKNDPDKLDIDFLEKGQTHISILEEIQFEMIERESKKARPDESAEKKDDAAKRRKQENAIEQNKEWVGEQQHKREIAN